MCLHVNYTSRRLAGGGDQSLKEASAVFRPLSTTVSTQQGSGRADDYKTDHKSYHKAFVVCKILTHDKNSNCVDKNNPKTGSQVAFWTVTSQKGPGPV